MGLANSTSAVPIAIVEIGLNTNTREQAKYYVLVQSRADPIDWADSGDVF